MRKFLSFLEKLESRNIYYTLNKTRNDYIRVDVAVPGQLWEIEFGADGDIIVERFISAGCVEGEESFKYLFDNFSD